MTILGILAGLLSAGLPDLLALFKEKQKLAHDLAVLEVQERMAASGHKFKLEEVNTEADIREIEALHSEFAKRGATWVWMEALIQSVRPILTYSFFILYASVKVSGLTLALGALDGDIAHSLLAVWHEEDQVIFSTIIAFWFGQRAMKHCRKGT